MDTTEAGLEDHPLISALPGGGFIAAWTRSDQSVESTDVFVRGQAFYVGTAVASVDHHLIDNPATGALLYDADGKGGAAQIQIAILSGLPALAAGDIWLI
ncbi:hypothetical protein HGI47_06855 [Novosphingobium sp. ERN07]|uniref:hypothetical protein n=1 Tax=Novosphingobium sp. ERN07 TaxID=2726187 RepID=UPI0014563C15|nr:hypothetical protein [Novosphingobium sp. ERN07]NLR70590.1 hypothetical protein [Novosphingobium sp. ERN07]